MALFGLDSSFVKLLRKELDIESVRLDQGSDFFVLPQFDAIYRYQGEKLKDIVCERLGKSTFGPQPPIEMEVPKSARVNTNGTSLIGPNYFRPGSVLLPQDRLLYHFIGQEASIHIENATNRERVFSNVPSKEKGKGFLSSSIQWLKLKNNVEKFARDSGFKFVLRCDINQCYFSLNQHELVNQLEHQGFPPELVKLTERFLSGLTLDRSSRGIPQGIYGSDVIGNGFLTCIDEFIEGFGLQHLRYVDDIYVFFSSSEQIRDFFPEFVKKLRDYDLALNERKTFIAVPSKLLKDETELDEAIKLAKQEAEEQLTDYEEVEIEGEYDEGSHIAILETVPDDEEVELEATREIFKSLDDFKGEERERAEAFCLSIFRRAADPVALPYVISRWQRHPEKAKEYSLYFNRFIGDEHHRSSIDALFIDSADSMIEYQWSWAALIMRRMNTMSSELLKISDDIRKDGTKHEVVRSLLTYSVCRHGSAAKKKEVRDGYSSSPLIIQLAILHSSFYFTAAERSAFLNTAEAHGELQKLMCNAVKMEIAAANKQ